MSAYIGLAALKEAVGLSGDAADTVDDGLLQAVIHRASALVDGYLEQIRPGYVGFAAGSNSRTAVGSNTRTYSGTGDDLLWIDDAASVAAVTVDGAAIDAAAYTAWPYNEVPKRALEYVLPATSLRGLLAANWPTGTANVAVTGFFGLPTVPDDVAQVTLALSVLLWRRYQAGDPQPTFSGVLGLNSDPEARAILTALWPRWGISAVYGG